MFLRWSQNQSAKGLKPEGWLYRAAANLAIDELRRLARRSKFDQLLGRIPRPATPKRFITLTRSVTESASYSGDFNLDKRSCSS